MMFARKTACLFFLIAGLLFAAGCGDEEECLTCPICPTTNSATLVTVDRLVSEATPSDRGSFALLLAEPAVVDLTFTCEVNIGAAGGPEDGDFTLVGATLGSGSTSCTIDIAADATEATVHLTAVTGDGDMDNEAIAFTVTEVSDSTACVIGAHDTAELEIIDNGVNP